MYKDEKKTNVTEDNSLTYVIPKEKYSKFDKQPVYVMFEDHLYANRWGILDWPMKRVVFTSKVFKLDSNVRYTLHMRILEEEKDPGFRIRSPLTMTQLMAAEGSIWIEMKSCEGIIKGQYNGWFRHNEEHSCLINERGLTLPYSGLDIGYTAYPSTVR